MYTALKITLLVLSVGLIIVVLLQKGKSAGLSGAITGGAEHLFGRAKARGLDLFLSRVTLVLAILFIVLTSVVAYWPQLTGEDSQVPVATPPPASQAPAAGQPAGGQQLQVTTPPADGKSQEIKVTPAPANDAKKEAAKPEAKSTENKSATDANASEKKTE